MNKQLAIRTKTDREDSLAAAEFLWDQTGFSGIHRLIETPVLKALALAQGARVLDLGCGNGAFTARLHELGFLIEGVDASCSGINIAAVAHPEIQFSQHDLTLPLPHEFCAAFDAVVSIEVVEHLLLPRKLLENARFALKPGGLLILSTPYHGYLKNLAIAILNGFDAHWHPLRDYGHIKFFSIKTLTSLVADCGFDVRYVLTVGRVPPFAHSMIIVAQRATTRGNT